MGLNFRDAAAKAAFVVSLLALAFFYGYATRGFKWFPHSLLDRAWSQGRQALAPPLFTTVRTYDRSGTRILEPGEMQPGLTLITTTWKHGDGWSPGLKLIDEEGGVVHEWMIDREEIFPDARKVSGGVPLDETLLHGTYLFPATGDVLVNYEYVGTARLDACGRILWRLPAGNHHSIARASDGTFWIPGNGYDHDAPPLNGTRPDSFPGLGDPAAQDVILRVDEDGRVLEAINVLEVLFENGLQRYVAKMVPRAQTDLTHLNDVEPLPPHLADEYPLFEAGDLVVSLHNLDLVFVMDPDSRQVRWHASEPFIEQHDPDFLGDGWIGVFDNQDEGMGRPALLGGSRIVALQPHTGATEVLFPTERSDPFYTFDMGKWQRLENGNLLLTESAAGRVAEVSPDGRTVWEWVSEPYRETRVPQVTEASRYDLTREDVASWPCASEGTNR